jgi:hypothetical protein
VASARRLYAQVLRPVTEVHAEKTRDIVGDITLLRIRPEDDQPRYEEVLALLTQVQVLASQPVRQLVGAWVRAMRESFDGMPIPAGSAITGSRPRGFSSS